MDIPKIIATSIRRSTVEAFATMLNVTLDPGEVVAGSESAAAPVAEPTEGVVSFIGLAGAWAGTGTIMCSASVACQMYEKMLMAEADAVNEEVLDAVAEITNIVIGSVKNDLEQHLGQLGLSIPTVIFGRNFKAKSAAHAQWVVERFRWEGEEFLVKLCLAPNEKQPNPRVTGQTVPLEVKV